jgi:opacity protein-like surface antigen
MILSLTCSLTAQDSSTRLSREERREVINEIGTSLVKNYISEKTAKECAEFLQQQFANGTYDRLTHPRQFAEKLTSDIFLMLKDKHVRVESLIPSEEKLQKENPLLSFLLQTRQRVNTHLGLQEVKTLEGNVGYIHISSFEPLESSRTMIDAAMKLVTHADALIIDLRKNNGGNPATVQYICSYFFDRPVLLNTFYWRRDNYTEEFWSLEKVSGKKIPDLPLFILTSKLTFSAAEEFAYNLKTRRRAIIIGEITAGGANPGFTFQINPRFTIFIPVGKAVNPVTGSNWEGKGVEPDIRIESSAALKIAMEKARQAGRIYREKRDEQAVQYYFELVFKLEQAADLFSLNREDSATALVTTSLQEGVEMDLLEEWSINSMGYRYLNQKKLALAITILQFNTTIYPHSANTYDSLGEAYFVSGETEQAIQNYQKSLELNPHNQNARVMLEKLGIHLPE